MNENEIAGKEKEQLVKMVAYLRSQGGFSLYVSQEQPGCYVVTASFRDGSRTQPSISWAESGSSLTSAQLSAVTVLANLVHQTESSKQSQAAPAATGGSAANYGSDRGATARGSAFRIKLGKLDPASFSAANDALKAAGWTFFGKKDGGDNAWYGNDTSQLPPNVAEFARPTGGGKAAITPTPAAPQQSPASDFSGYPDAQGSANIFGEDDIPW